MRFTTLALAMVLFSCVSLTVDGADTKSIPTRGWNCFAAGGLIDGSCTGVVDRSAIIQNAAGEKISVPLELFNVDEQKLICEHFGLEVTKVAPADFSGHPWHSSRGGVMVMGTIEGRDGMILRVVDGKGRKFRVPFGLLASGAQEHAKKAVTTLEGKPFDPVLARPATPKPVEPSIAARPSPPPVVRTPIPAEVKPPKPADTAASKPAVPAVPSLSPTAPDAFPTPAGAADPLPRGEVRAWKMRGNGGLVLGEGRFVAVDRQVVRIVTKDGRPSQVPLELLCDADRQYAETLAKGGEPTKAPAGAVVVAHEQAKFWATKDRRALLLIDGKTVVVLSADGKQKIAQHELTGEAAAFAERDAYYVAAIGKELQLLDKTTFKPIARHELWKSKRIRDVALHPQRPIAYVSVEMGVDEVRNNPDETQRVLLVNEKSGDAGEPGDVFASWLAVDPQGKYVYAGFRDVFKSGSDVRINGDGRLLETPKYANIDILSRFRIEGDKLEMDEMFKNAGGNGQGLVLSPDGGRVAYLSYAGYPTFSGNVAALDARNFKKKPVSFAMKDKSDCKRMVFHPVLDLVASPARNGAVLYDATTGEVSPERLTETDALADCAVHALAFTPDGTQLALVLSKGGGAKYLQSVPLKLTAAEQERCKTPGAKVESSPPKTASPKASAPRTFSDASGVFQLQATYRGREGEIVLLEKSDGTVLRVPLGKLCDADKSWIEKQ